MENYRKNTMGQKRILQGAGKDMPRKKGRGKASAVNGDDTGFEEYIE